MFLRKVTVIHPKNKAFFIRFTLRNITKITTKNVSPSELFQVHKRFTCSLNRMLATTRSFALYHWTYVSLRLLQIPASNFTISLIPYLHFQVTHDNVNFLRFALRLDIVQFLLRAFCYWCIYSYNGHFKRHPFQLNKSNSIR